MNYERCNGIHDSREDEQICSDCNEGYRLLYMEELFGDAFSSQPDSSQESDKGIAECSQGTESSQDADCSQDSGLGFMKRRKTAEWGGYIKENNKQNSASDMQKEKYNSSTDTKTEKYPKKYSRGDRYNQITSSFDEDVSHARKQRGKKYTCSVCKESFGGLEDDGSLVEGSEKFKEEAKCARSYSEEMGLKFDEHQFYKSIVQGEWTCILCDSTSC